jgi:hypothetical protein
MKSARWHVLVERYAMYAREFSDSVARLGRANLSLTECRELLEGIRVYHDVCTAAANDAEQYIKQKGGEPQSEVGA